MHRRDMHTKCQSENLKERDHLRDILIDDRIILKWILKKQVVKMWTGLNWLGRGLVVSSCEHHHVLGSIKWEGGEDCFTNEQLLASQKALCSMELLNVEIVAPSLT